MVLPAVAAGQFYVAEAAHKDQGFQVPIAVATWAFVSEEVDRRLQGEVSHRIRLRPDQWRSGEIGWIIDLIGTAAGVLQALRWMGDGPFKTTPAQLVVRDARGEVKLETLNSLLEQADRAA